VVKEVVSGKIKYKKSYKYQHFTLIHSRSSVKVLQVIRQGFAGHPSNRLNIIQVLLLEYAGHPSWLREIVQVIRQGQLKKPKASE
jgi:hypothetical protein